MFVSLFRSVLIISLIIILNACQLPVDGSSLNQNNEGFNAGYAGESHLLEEKEIQNVNHIDSFVRDDTSEVVENIEVVGEGDVYLTEQSLLEHYEQMPIEHAVFEGKEISDISISNDVSVGTGEDLSIVLTSSPINNAEVGNTRKELANVFEEGASDDNGKITQIPVANTDSFVVRQSEEVILNILGNDEGVGDELQILVISQAENGVVSVMDNGFVSYSPNISYFGKDEFVYKIVDENENSSIASVRLQIDCVNNCTSMFELNWVESKSVDVIGYNVYVGRSADALDSVFKLGNEVRFAYLAEKKGEYYFAVSAINGEGVESELTQTVLGVF